MTGISTGAPVRALKNKLTKEYERLEKEGATFEEIEALGVGGLRKAFLDGDTDMGSLMAGQSAAMVNEIKTCEDIIKELIDSENVINTVLNKLR